MNLLLALLVLQAGSDDFGKRFDVLVSALSSTSIEERSAAEAEIRKLVVDGPRERRSLLKKRAAAETNVQVKASLESLVAGLPLFEVKLTIGAEGAIGKQLAFRLRIKNLDDEDHIVCRCLAGSDQGRAPGYGATVTCDDGKPVQLPVPLNCIPGWAPLEETDFARVKPGEEMDAFEGGRHFYLQQWRPARAGKYTVEVEIDFTCENFDAWFGGRPTDANTTTLKKLVAGMPKVKLKAKVEFDIKP